METPSKRKILLLGKLPPPFMGPSVAFHIIINSELKNIYDLLALDIKANESLNTLGKWSFRKLFINVDKYSKLYTILKNEKPELVLIPVSQSTIGFIKDSLFILVCSLFPVKVLIQLRGGNFRNWYHSSNYFIRGYVKFTLNKTHGVIVQGKILKKLFNDFYKEENIFVVPNGGDFVFDESIPNNTGTVKITYLGNLQPSKGIEDVIEAVMQLNKQIPGNFSLDVIGEWRNTVTKERCIKMVEENQLPVNFLNGLKGTEKLNQLSSSDIFVFTPREPEGHPWVILEAMAAGLPVVASNQGAISESVIEGVNGFIVPPRNPALIAEKLKLLIEDHTLRSRMGVKSREFYLEKFTEARMVENYSSTFNSVLNRD